MTYRLMLIAILSAFMLVLAACSETTPERVEDSTDDTEEVVEPDDEDSPDDTVVIEDEDDASEDVTGGDDAAEEEQSTDGDADDSVENEQEPSDEAEGGAELEEAEGFTVGDTVRMGDLVMTLHTVRWDEGSEFMSPDEGTRWLVADIEIENEADSATSISSLLMFDLVDQDNRKRDIAFMADTEGSLDGELGAGRSLRGDLAWEVRDEQAQWELVFTPQLFGFGQAIFDISHEDF
jgi:hypothetical protein